MRIFVKILEGCIQGEEVPYQILVTKEYDPDGFPVMKVTTQFPGVSPSVSYGFNTVEQRDTSFDLFDSDHADAFLTHVKVVLDGNDDETL